MKTMKVNYSILAFAGLIALAGCGESKKQIAERETLQAKIDSLQKVANYQERSVKLVDQVGSLLDSIESQRNWVKLELETGMTGEQYLNRIGKINEFLSNAEGKIKELEKTRGNYAAQVKRLKAELEKQNAEIVALRDMVDKVTSENIQLSSKLTFTETQLEELSLLLESRKEELTLMEARLAGMIQAAQVSEAEALYSRGEAMELVASRTQLAPKRKQDALRQALEFYEKSLALGNSKAKEKVDLVSPKVKNK